MRVIGTALAMLLAAACKDEASPPGAVVPVVPTGEAVGIIVKFTAELGNDAFAEHVRAIQRVATEQDLSLTYDRAGALGTHVFTFGKQIPIAPAENLARAVSARVPDIEYSEPDAVVYPADAG